MKYPKLILVLLISTFSLTAVSNSLAGVRAQSLENLLFAPNVISQISPSPSSEDPRQQAWDDFLDALKKNIIEESPENFKQVRSDAKALQALPDLPSGLQDYLNIIIGYDQDVRSFNNSLIKDGLDNNDLIINPNISEALSDKNKAKTADEVLQKLNDKFRSQLLATSQGLSSTPSPTPQASDDSSLDLGTQTPSSVEVLGTIVGTFLIGSGLIMLIMYFNPEWNLSVYFVSLLSRVKKLFF